MSDLLFPRISLKNNPACILCTPGGESEIGSTSIYARHGYLDEKRAAIEKWAERLREILAGRTMTTKTKTTGISS